MPKSAISIASPSSEKRHHGPHEVVKSAYAYSGENHLEGERQMVGMHHRIFANPTRNLAATITPATHTIAHVARSRMSASRLRDALNAEQHAAFKIIYRVMTKRSVNRLHEFAPDFEAVRNTVRPGEAREHVHNQARLVCDACLRGG
jgi:hypothetical protein